MGATEPGAVSGSSAGARPDGHLSFGSLLRLSLYWFGLSSVFAAYSIVMQGRLEYGDLARYRDEAGAVLFRLSVMGALIACVLQPTIGAVSDYTRTRWGRRKPYIVIGTVLDLVFLVGIATSTELVAIAAFVALLQISSNTAQGPFQGYVPDLVPEHQVGLASGLVGLMQLLGNGGGFIIGTIAVWRGEFGLGLIAVGVVEFATMIALTVSVRDLSRPRERGERSWWRVAREAWGADALRRPGFAPLLASRWTFLTGGGMLSQLGLFYLSRTFGIAQGEVWRPMAVMIVLLGLAAALSVIPAGRLSNRIGRRRPIWLACAIGVVGLLIATVASSVWVALVGVTLYGAAAGVFLAVDWALMTDLIPRESAGRYMGLSNVATASAGISAVAIGGLVMDLVGGAFEPSAGPRAALLLGAGLLAASALFLRGVPEPAPAGGRFPHPELDR